MASNSLVTVMQGRWDDSPLAQKKIPASTSTRCCQARRHVIHQLVHDLISDVMKAAIELGMFELRILVRDLLHASFARCTVRFSKGMGGDAK
ncbi:unnamed protein product [Sphagnum balticum]